MVATKQQHLNEKFEVSRAVLRGTNWSTSCWVVITRSLCIRARVSHQHTLTLAMRLPAPPPSWDVSISPIHCSGIFGPVFPQL
jgi:hypothetical protein